MARRRSEVYQRLRPQTKVEACRCTSVKGLFLLGMGMLSDNPLYCSTCRKEVDPERLRLTIRETDVVADWYRVANSLFLLWLNSGEYEKYAKDRMIDPAGQVNRKGLEVARMLSRRVPTRYWYFYDTDDGTPTRCPVCRRKLDTDVKWGTGACRKCPIQV